jgi:hypothetical protein
MEKVIKKTKLPVIDSVDSLNSIHSLNSIKVSNEVLKKEIGKRIKINFQINKQYLIYFAILIISSFLVYYYKKKQKCENKDNKEKEESKKERTKRKTKKIEDIVYNRNKQENRSDDNIINIERDLLEITHPPIPIGDSILKPISMEIKEDIELIENKKENTSYFDPMENIDE